MERIDMERWLAGHPRSIHDDPQRLLDRCEAEAKDHARHDAWLHAREVAEDCLHRFERRFGLPASDVFVTREVCHEIARELKTHEPSPDDRVADSWVSPAVLDAFEPEARSLLRDWLEGLAEREEHATWREIVRMTDHIAKSLIRAGHMTDQCDWDLEHAYPRVAERVVRMLIEEYEAHLDRGGDGSSGATASH
jgi:hypothetical protein